MRRPGAEKDTGTNMTNEETTKATAAAEQCAHVAAEKGASKKVATKKGGAPKGQKTAKGAKQKKTAKATKKSAKSPRKGAAPRAASKSTKILEMIRRTKGATLAEIMEASDWQAHSVRGFISTAGKKHGINIES